MGSVGKRSLPKCRLRIFRGPCGGRGSGFLSRNISLAVILALVFAPLRDAGVAVLLRQRFSGVSLSGSVAGKVVGRGDFRSWFSLIQLLFSPLYADSGDVLSAGATEPMQDTLDSGKVAGDTIASPVADQEIEKDSATVQSDSLSSSEELNAATTDTSALSSSNDQGVAVKIDQNGIVKLEGNEELLDLLPKVLPDLWKVAKPFGDVYELAFSDRNIEVETWHQVEVHFRNVNAQDQGAAKAFRNISVRGGKDWKSTEELIKKLRAKGMTDFELLEVLFYISTSLDRLDGKGYLFIPLPLDLNFPLSGDYHLSTRLVAFENNLYLEFMDIGYYDKNGNDLLLVDLNNYKIKKILEEEFRKQGFFIGMPGGYGPQDTNDFMRMLLLWMLNKVKLEERLSRLEFARRSHEMLQKGYFRFTTTSTILVFQADLGEGLNLLPKLRSALLDGKIRAVTALRNALRRFTQQQGFPNFLQRAYFFRGDLVIANTGDLVKGAVGIVQDNENPNEFEVGVALGGLGSFSFSVGLPEDLKVSKVKGVKFLNFSHDKVPGKYSLAFLIDLETEKGDEKLLFVGVVIEEKNGEFYCRYGSATFDFPLNSSKSEFGER